MPRTSTIENHPHRGDIERAIASGKMSYRQISKQWGVSPGALYRFAHGRMAKAVAKVEARREADDLKTAENVMQEINSQVTRLKALLEAATRHLTDPATGELSFALDARDAEVVYDDVMVGEDGKPRTVRRKGTLQELLNGIRGVVAVNVKRDDPRALFVKISAALGDYLERVAKILGMLGETTIVLEKTDVFMFFIADLTEALAAFPDAKAAVMAKFEEKARVGKELEGEVAREV
jgi:hypothetical protein